MQEQEQEEIIRAAMGIIGSKKTPRKAASSRANISQFNAKKQAEGLSEEERAKLGAAQRARREREREQRLAAGLVDVGPKRPRGRPRTIATTEAQAGEKRPVGRPKKQAGQTTAGPAETPENGAQEQGQAAYGGPRA